MCACVYIYVARRTFIRIRVDVCRLSVYIRANERFNRMYTQRETPQIASTYD